MSGERGADRLEILQVMRLVAALAVVCVHIPAIKAGNWGVDLFFVISGFVICLASYRSPDRFLTKRLIRVVPIYWIMTLAVFAIAVALPHLLNSTSADPVHLLKSLFFVPFDKNGMGHRPILFVGWTLNFEIFFYCSFALALLVSHRYSPSICAALVAVAHVSALLWAADYPFVAYQNPRILAFPVGMLVWLIYVRPASWKPNAAVVAASVLAGYLATGTSQPAAVTALLSGLAVLAGALLLEGRRFPALLVLLGDASYSLYLSHAYVIQVAAKSGLFGRSLPLDAAMTVIVVALCLAVAAALWLKAEKPMNDYLRTRLLHRPEPRPVPAGA